MGRSSVNIVQGKDQAHSGECWAGHAAGQVEDHMRLAYHVRVELTKDKTGKAKECIKCRDLEAGRDRVKGGWKMAQLIDLEQERSR